MALLKALCWALIFIIRIRFPPGTSLALHKIVRTRTMDVAKHISGLVQAIYIRKTPL